MPTPYHVAVFLAVSWTWVIGMHLPTILMRDMGIGAWLVFALPNIVGAGAMGRLVPTAEHSRQMERHHGRAMQAFAIVTIAFHLYFALAILRQWVGPVIAVLAAASLVVCVLRPIFANLRLAMIWSPLIWIGSVLLVGIAVALAGYERPVGDSPTTAFVGLAIACVFGFGLCPYLDPTFHAARQAAADRGPQAFALGFGIFFLVMIGGTFLYAPTILQRAPQAALALLAGHVLWQAIFTVSTQRLAMGELHERTCGSKRFSRAMVVGLAAALFLALVDGFAAWHDPVLGRYDVPEIGYRIFMGFYGLIFPTYVWLFCFRHDGPPSRRGWVIYALVVTLALPFFAYGFLWSDLIWCGVGMVPVLAAKAFVRGPGPHQPAGVASPASA